MAHHCYHHILNMFYTSTQAWCSKQSIVYNIDNHPMVCNQEIWNQSTHVIHENREFFHNISLLHNSVCSYIYMHDIFFGSYVLQAQFKRYLTIILWCYQRKNTREFGIICIQMWAPSPGREVIRSCNRYKLISLLKMVHDYY